MLVNTFSSDLVRIITIRVSIRQSAPKIKMILFGYAFLVPGGNQLTGLLSSIKSIYQSEKS